MSTHFIGVDAGGTRTRALVAGEDGTVVGRGTAGGANAWSSGGDAAATVAQAVREAMVGCDAASVVAGTVAFAGGGATSIRIATEVAAAWQSMGITTPPSIVLDVLAAYAAGTTATEGLVLTAGTGSIAAYVRERAIVRRAGGHGWLVGDEGSAVWLGVQGTAAALWALDGRGPATKLAEHVPGALGIAAAGARATAEHIVTAVYSRPPAEMGGLAPVVVDAAASGDAVAGELVSSAAQHLVRTAVAAAERAPDAVVLGGSLLHGVPIIRDAVAGALGARWPGAEVTEAASGEAGAVALAMARHAGEAISQDVFARLIAGT